LARRSNDAPERKYKGLVHGGVQILRDEGIAGLYKG
jgi:hypothetical protein